MHHTDCKNYINLDGITAMCAFTGRILRLESEGCEACEHIEIAEKCGNCANFHNPNDSGIGICTGFANPNWVCDTNGAFSCKAYKKKI